MKKLYFFVVFFSFSICALAQTTIYARFTDYNNNVPKTDGTTGTSKGLITTNTIDPSSTELFKLTTFTQSVEQTLNIGSQSTGAGAGKVIFNPLSFSRPVDAISSLLFSNSASGTPFQTVEIFFTDASNRIAAKQLYKLVAVKTIGWSGASCSSDCPAVLENVSMEYGVQIDFIYKAGNNYLTSPLIKGWNRVKNVADNDPNSVIK
jgi:type VI protein secretion system component Hcp